MNVRNKKIVMILGGIFLFSGGIVFWCYPYVATKNNGPYYAPAPGDPGMILGTGEAITMQYTPPTADKEPSPEIRALLETYRGVIASSTTKGLGTYTNKKAGVQFSYQEGWGIEDNFLGYGEYSSIKLFNYSPPRDYDILVSRPDGKNRIEVHFGENDYYRTNRDIDPRSTAGEEKIKKQMMIAGQPATRFELKEDRTPELLFHKIIYYISVPNSEKYLTIRIYGDPANFHQLDELVKTIKWLPVEKK